MTSRIAPLLYPPLAFAHRGARAIAQDNTIESFTLARNMGATAMESDAWVTADGVAVLDHDGVVGRRPTRKSISKIGVGELPDHVPTLDAFFDAIGTDVDLSLDIKDAAAIDAVVGTVRRWQQAGAPELPRRMWLCHPDLATVAEWKRRYEDFRLVHSTRLARLDGGPERHAARLAEANIDVINMHYSDWTGGLVTLFHRFDVLCFAWDCQFERIIDAMYDNGMDGVYSDHVDRLLTSHATFFGQP